MKALDAFIAGLPTAELDMQSDGRLEPELLVAVLRRRQVTAADVLRCDG
jgi:hypothetical protein